MGTSRGILKTLPSDPGVTYDEEVILDISEIVPQVTWGTSPQDEVGIMVWFRSQ